MASGFAKALREMYPLAYCEYMVAFAHGLSVGKIVWTQHGDILIGNAITQKYYGRDQNVIYADYQGIRDAMKLANEKVKGISTTIGMPMIGAGLANGDWKIISRIIEEESHDFTPVIYVLEEQLFKQLTQEEHT